MNGTSRTPRALAHIAWACVALMATPARAVATPAEVRKAADAASAPYIDATAVEGGLVPNLDVVLSGEGCEWESFEYFEDWIDAGRGKGLIMLGLAVTSDPAAKEFASWVQSVVGSTRVAFLPVGDPFTPVHAGALQI